MKLKLLLSALLFIYFSSISLSQTNFKNELELKSDNDAYLAMGQDRYYTNGIFISYRRAVKQEHTSADFSKIIWGAEIGQKMYNAQSGNIPDIQYVDRPFAAYLYAGASLNWFFKNEQSIKGSLQAGVIGPAALGEDAQKLLHNIAGFYKIEGWQYQINNEFEINTTANYISLLKRNKKSNTDLSFNSYANIGTTFSGAGAGATIRLGKINKLTNSVSTSSRISNTVKDSVPDKEFFFFARPMVHLVAYDASISGGLYRDNKGPVLYNSKPIVLSQEFGIMYAKNHWALNFSIIFKTKEVKSIARAHQYGTIDVSYSF